MAKFLEKRFILMLLISFMMMIPSMNPITPVLAGEIDEVDGFQNAPNYRWRNVTTPGTNVEEYMEGDFLFINNTNLTGEIQNYTKARRLNDRDMYFNSRFLLDVGGKFNGSEWYLEDLSDLTDYNEGDLESYSGGNFTHSYAYFDGAGVIETYGEYVDLNLTAHYELDEGSGTNINDTSGNNHNCTGIAQSWVSSEIGGYAYDINDFPSPDSYDIPDHDDFTFNNGANDIPFTIEFWFNRSSANQGTIIGKSGISNKEFDIWITSGGGIRVQLFDGDNDYIGRSSGTAVSLNAWNHITIRYNGNGTNEGIDIFQNASITDTGDLSSGVYQGINNTNEIIYVGGTDQGQHGFPDGIIDEIRFWRSNLTNSEITAIYNGAPSFLPSRDTRAPQSTYEIETSNTVDSPKIYRYLQMEFYFESEENGNITSFEIYDQDSGWYYNDTTLRTNGTNEVLQIDLGAQNNGYWLNPGASNDIGMRFATSLDQITIAINYTFIGNFPYWNLTNQLGDYNAEEGFKFFLANEDDNTSMEWEITHNSTLQDSENYSLRMNIYNSTGYPVLTSNYLFEYHYTTHGWLEYTVEWNVDTKRIRVRLEDDLGNRIVDYRDISDIYTVEQLIREFNYAWSFGKPHFGFNATTPHMARIWIVIDYIDANYDIMEFIEPKTQNPFGITTAPSDDDSYFTSANHWSVTAIGLEFDGVDNSYKKYYHDIDHFDSISFDFQLNISGLETDDYAIFRMFAYNVKHDGSLENVLRIDIQHNGFAVKGYSKPEADIYHSTSGTNWVKVYDFDFTYDDPAVDMAFELFYDDEESLIYQSNIHSRQETFFSNIKHTPNIDDTFTKEFVIVLEYAICTDNGAYSDDEVFFRINEYDVVRKGILEDLLGGFINLVVGILTIIFAPIIIAVLFLGSLIVKALITLGKFLEPLFSVLGGIMEGLGSILDSIAETLLGIAAEIGTFLLGLVGDFISDALEFLGTIITELINLGASIVFVFWDDFIGGPDLLAIVKIVIVDFLFPIIVGIPGFLMDLITILFAIGNVMLLGFWFYAIFLGFASQKFDPFAGISEFIERMLKGPDVTIIGIGPFRVPIGLFVVLPLSLFIILAPTGSMLVFW